MVARLPGTTFELGELYENAVSDVFRPMFAGGGLTMSQVVQLTGLEPYIIQNWVKRGFLSPPVKKQYSKNQFCRIVIINMLRESLQMDKICSLLSYINNRLDDESDDRMGDSEIYNEYCNLLFCMQGRELCQKALDSETEKLVSAYDCDESTKIRLKKVLTVMALAHRAAQLRQIAEQTLCEID